MAIGNHPLYTLYVLHIYVLLSPCLRVRIYMRHAQYGMSISISTSESLVATRVAPCNGPTPSKERSPAAIQSGAAGDA